MDSTVRREHIKRMIRDIVNVTGKDVQKRREGIAEMYVGIFLNEEPPVKRKNKEELAEAQHLGYANPIPIRAVVSNWGLGKCKRCLLNGVADGDLVVRIYGLGWWHDACYRVVNPSFYEGL